MNIRKLRNNYAKNRPHDLTTESWIVAIEDQKVALKTALTLILYFCNTVLASTTTKV